VNEDSRLADTRRAFNRSAADYDGPSGNNVRIQRMRSQMWKTLTATFPRGARLLDLGCGTGIDAAYLASQGYRILATDWSQSMVERTRARINDNGLEHSVSTRILGIQDLNELHGETFDGIFSDLGPLNCAPDLYRAAQSCAALLRPGGRMIASVIGRFCPWESLYYIVHAKWRRAFLRYRSSVVPVPLNGETVWTRYFTPGQFYRAFAGDFELIHYRGLCLCAPPPYMVGVYERLPLMCDLADWLDDRVCALPVVRNAGDHFLMVLSKRS
jgi:2-polyprenyl-3-methyl-5-hydroxy-6-metoxy-1,4-benzoquinol methylase